MRLLLLLCCVVFSFNSFAGVKRKILIDNSRSLQLNRKNVEIVVPEKSPKTVVFAAEELKKSLGESLGGKIPVVNKPDNNKISIILGDNTLSRKAGISIKDIPRDGYIIKSLGKDIYILGQDDPKRNPVKLLRTGSWPNYYERGTLFGVYDFLERIVGVRFYFPGKIGTVVPKHKSLKVGKLDILNFPDFTARKFSKYSGRWYEGNNRDFKFVPGKNLNFMRLRMATSVIPNCHGLARMGYLDRFGKSNPEYFALRSNGKRHNNPSMSHPGQLCYNSGIRDEVYKDAKAYLTGKPASSRGASHKGRVHWNPSACQPGYFNPMPQDGYYPCRCPKCIKYYKGGNPAISKFMWEFVVDIANRLQKTKSPAKSP